MCVFFEFFLKFLVLARTQEYHKHHKEGALTKIPLYILYIRVRDKQTRNRSFPFHLQESRSIYFEFGLKSNLSRFYK
jgi:hypothetical protein